jgi:hypothetical protein
MVSHDKRQNDQRRTHHHHLQRQRVRPVPGDFSRVARLVPPIKPATPVTSPT